MKKLLVFAMLAMVLVGCYSTRQVSMLEDYKHACVGLSRDNAITQFGTPCRTYQGDQGEVLVFESYEGEQSVLNRRYLELTFGQDGLCKGVQTNYTKPEKYRDDKKTNWTVWGSIAGTAVAAGVSVVVVYLMGKVGK